MTPLEAFALGVMVALTPSMVLLALLLRHPPEINRDLPRQPLPRVRLGDME